MKAYITKYALTQGVFVVYGRKDNYSGGFFGSRRENGVCEMFFGKNFHFEKESALKRCEEMKAKKLKSLRSNIKKIEAMEFVIDD